MATPDSKKGRLASNGQEQSAGDSRPLPKIPGEGTNGYNSKELEKNRYAYFMSEVQKWKNEKQPSRPSEQGGGSVVGTPARRLPEHSLQQDQSISWNLENDMSMSNRVQSNAKQQSKAGYHKDSESRFGRRDRDETDMEDGRSNQSFDGSSVFSHKKSENVSTSAHSGSHPRRGVVPVGVKMHNSGSDQRNIFKDSAVESGNTQSSHEGHITYHNADLPDTPPSPPPRHSSNNSSPSPKPVQHSKHSNTGSLIVPANLANLTEHQIDQLRDVRNALALISTQKTRVEHLKKERTVLKDELKKAYAVIKKLKEDMGTKTSQLTQASARVGSLEKDKASLVAEVQDLRKRLADESNLMQLREELRLSQADNETLRQRVSGLQVDQKVLEKILKEMVFEKQREVGFKYLLGTRRQHRPRLRVSGAFTHGYRSFDGEC